MLNHHTLLIFHLKIQHNDCMDSHALKPSQSMRERRRRRRNRARSPGRESSPRLLSQIFRVGSKEVLVLSWDYLQRHFSWVHDLVQDEGERERERERE
jgi:hypothetical protein